MGNRVAATTFGGSGCQRPLWDGALGIARPFVQPAPSSSLPPVCAAMTKGCHTKLS